jgi:excisionase family DNA binding protein
MFTVREIAERLKVSAACVYALTESGQLGCHRIGLGRGVIRISEENLREYLDRCKARAAGETVPRRPRPRLKHIKL